MTVTGERHGAVAAHAGRAHREAATCVHHPAARPATAPPAVSFGAPPAGVAAFGKAPVAGGGGGLFGAPAAARRPTCAWGIITHLKFRMSKNAQEPLLEENPNRFVVFPIKDHDVWGLYKRLFDWIFP